MSVFLIQLYFFIISFSEDEQEDVEDEDAKRGRWNTNHSYTLNPFIKKYFTISFFTFSYMILILLLFSVYGWGRKIRHRYYGSRRYGRRHGRKYGHGRRNCKCLSALVI